MEKDKKKTLTISSSLKKKIDTSAINTSGKKSFSFDKKKTSRPVKPFKRASATQNINIKQDFKKKNFARKFIEQQATKVPPHIYPFILDPSRVSGRPEQRAP